MRREARLSIEPEPPALIGGRWFLFYMWVHSMTVVYLTFVAGHFDYTWWNWPFLFLMYLFIGIAWPIYWAAVVLHWAV